MEITEIEKKETKILISISKDEAKKIRASLRNITWTYSSQKGFDDFLNKDLGSFYKLLRDII